LVWRKKGAAFQPPTTKQTPRGWASRCGKNQRFERA